MKPLEIGNCHNLQASGTLLVTPESSQSTNGALEEGQSNGLDRTAIMPANLMVYSLSEPGQGCRAVLRSRRNDVLPNCKLDQFGVRS